MRRFLEQAWNARRRVYEGGGSWFLARLALVAAIAFAAYFAWGFSFGILTNEYHATIVLKSLDPRLFQGDLLASTLEGYASPLWILVSWLARWIPKETLFVLGFLLSRMLFAWAVGALSASWTQGRSASRLSWGIGAVSTLSMGFLLGLPAGGDGVLGPYFSQTFLSVAILLFALSKAVRGHIISSAFVLGIGFNFNIMQGVLAGTCIVGFWFVRSRRSSDLPSLGTILLAGLVTSVVALPAILMAVGSLVSNLGEIYRTGSDLADWARFWLAGHFFLDGRNPLQLASMVACLCLPILLAIRLVEFPRWSIVLPLAAPAVLTSLHLVLVSEFPSRILFQLHLMRSDVLAYCTSVALATALVLNSSGRDRRDVGLAAAILGLILVGSHLLAAVLATAMLTIPKGPANRLPWRAWGGILLGGGVLAMSFASGLHLASAIIAAGLAFALFPPRIGRPWVTPALVASCLAVPALASVQFHRKTWSYHSPVRTFGQESLHSAQLSEFGQASPPNALFLVPPTVNARPFLERGVWFNFYDGATFLWRKGAGTEVTRRMEILGIEYNPNEILDMTLLSEQWYNGLCSSIPLVAAEGVTHVVLPDRADPYAPWSVHDPIEALEVLACPLETDPSGPAGGESGAAAR